MGVGGRRILNGRDDPAAVVRDSQRVMNRYRREIFSPRREKVKWAEGGASALPGFDVPSQRYQQETLPAQKLDSAGIAKIAVV